MASIFLDRQSQTWKLKATEGGQDKRIKLRKVHPGELSRPIPADVLKLAMERGFAAPVESPIILNVNHDKAPDNLIQFLDYFLADYAKTHRPGSIKRIGGIVRYFRKFCLRPTLQS